MKQSKIPPRKISPKIEATYFGIEAYLGTTKHGGSVALTRELIELCHISEDSYVLDVGCGVGATACYLATKIGCRVIGVDIREGMVTRAMERAIRQIVTSRVAFHQEVAQHLAFDDGIFDVVISESVTLFVSDREKAVREYARVIKPGGYVGLHEEIWLKTPVPVKVAEYMKRGVELPGDIPTSDYWQDLMGDAELHDIVVRTYGLMRLREFSRLWRYSPADLARATYRMFVLLRRFEIRTWMRSVSRPPLSLAKYLGYGVYVGWK